MNLMPPPAGTGSDAGRSPYPDLDLRPRPGARTAAVLPAGPGPAPAPGCTGPARVRTLGLLQVSTYRERPGPWSVPPTTPPVRIRCWACTPSAGRPWSAGMAPRPAGPTDLSRLRRSGPPPAARGEPFELHPRPRAAARLRPHRRPGAGSRPPAALRRRPGGAPCSAPSRGRSSAPRPSTPRGQPSAWPRRSPGSSACLSRTRRKRPTRRIPRTTCRTGGTPRTRGPNPRRSTGSCSTACAPTSTRGCGTATLTPATVAAAQHIPVRYLHKLFEGQGSTIGRWILHRRLEE